MREHRHRVLAVAQAALACTMSSACASLHAANDLPEQVDRAGAILVSDALSAPPAGIVELCLRSSLCADVPADTQTEGDRRAGDWTMSAAPLSGPRPIAPSPRLMADLVSFDSARSAQSIEFQLMLRAAALKGGLEARSGGRERLSPDRWRQLVTTNRFVNHAIAALSDEDQFGVGERWSMPLLNAEETDRRPQGDCEDYALEKRERLLALGWPPHAVSLAVARVPAGTLHTVLIARTDRGDFVLDNLHAQPRSIAELDYQWLSRQLGAELWVWGAARLVGADSPAG